MIRTQALCTELLSLRGQSMRLCEAHALHYLVPSWQCLMLAVLVRTVQPVAIARRRPSKDNLEAKWAADLALKKTGFEF